MNRSKVDQALVLIFLHSVLLGLVFQRIGRDLVRMGQALKDDRK